MGVKRRMTISPPTGVTFPHPAAFWLGTLATIAGVVLHLPMYLNAGDMGYRLVGMPMDGPMKIGMALVVLGLVLSFYGLYPDQPKRPRDWYRESGCVRWMKRRFAPRISAFSP